MGRFMRKMIGQVGQRIADQTGARNAFEDNKPDAMKNDIRMISGCEDAQTSADVSNVADFSLPDPAGRAGGACTATLLNILYQDEHVPADDLSFIQVLTKMRQDLQAKGFQQIPQLTSSNPIDINLDFDLVPKAATGTRRAVMIGINYVGHSPGELRGCQNDVLNMKKYIMNVHGFNEENITVLMDDGEHESPTKDNMINAYNKVVAESGPGDAIFLHYSGHGTKVNDDDHSEEHDGYDEALVPLDYKENGMIRDDDLYEILVKPLGHGVHMVSLMDCCHSGTILDLPYIFKADGSFEEMKLDDTLNLDGLMQSFGGPAMNIVAGFF